jgi:autotransporter strand-loop-strand O-heptosyltransferase
MGNSHPTGAKKLPAGPIETVIDTLSECQAVIGISSGLTWLSWAVGTPTIQVSGFTEPYNEPDNGMVKLAAPFGACSGCANRLKLDAGDWNWCPEHKGTDRQFECSKLITSERVITELKKILI